MTTAAKSAFSLLTQQENKAWWFWYLTNIRSTCVLSVQKSVEEDILSCYLLNTVHKTWWRPVNYFLHGYNRFMKAIGGINYYYTHNKKQMANLYPPSFDKQTRTDIYGKQQHAEHKVWYTVQFPETWGTQTNTNHTALLRPLFKSSACLLIRPRMIVLGAHENCTASVLGDAALYCSLEHPAA